MPRHPGSSRRPSASRSITTEKAGPGRTHIIKDGRHVLTLAKGNRYHPETPWAIIGRGSAGSLGEVRGRYKSYNEAMKAARRMVGGR